MAFRSAPRFDVIGCVLVWSVCCIKSGNTSHAGLCCRAYAGRQQLALTDDVGDDALYSLTGREPVLVAWP